MSQSPPRSARRARPANDGPALPAVPEPVRASAEFEGTEARLRLSCAAVVTAVTFDSHPLPDDRWRQTGPDTLRVACPPGAFDGAAHRLRLIGPPEPAELEFRSDYHFALDRLDDLRIVGWIYDALRPTSALTLDVAGESFARFALLNTLDHPALADHAPAIAGGGFDIALPPRPARARPELVSITVQGTALQPFGAILRGTGLPAAALASAAAARALRRTGPGMLAGAALLPGWIGALDAPPEATPPSPDSVTRLRGTLGLARPAPPSVDVVVPAYRGVAETLTCLRSVLASQDRVARRVIVLDDCSPEPELTEALRALAAEGSVIYLRNERNLGFVGTANRGMALSAEADVLLLNSDTVVPPGFLDRLYRAAASDPAIATVTPLSNNATICSLPAPPGTDGDPYGLDAQDIDALCREVNAGETRDLPTAHGFCMFIKRAAIDDVGLFDAAQFGAGYGEENDFSLRAFARGWRNVCAADVYVRHLGAVSFAETREAQVAANLRKVETLYPYYHHFVADFLRTDPLHDLRNRVQKAVWQRIGRSVLFVTLSLEGGAVRHVDDMMRRVTAEGFLALALCMGRDADRRPMLSIRRWNSAETLRYPHPAPTAEALADILDLAPRMIHVQHLIDLPDRIGDFIRDCGIPYAVTLHDFFYACPKVTLLDEGGSYCGMPPAAKCTACVKHGPIHASIHPALHDYTQTGEGWRAKWDAMLREAVQVIAPSHDTAERYAALFPGLACDVLPHFGDAASAAPAAPAADRLRVVVPGAIGPQKGSRQLLDLVRHCARWEEDIGFVIAGHTDRDKAFEAYGNVELTGRYEAAAAGETLRGSGARVALFLSIFPETYSYTLSESLAAGLVPVAYDFGAIGERLRAMGAGVLVPLGAPPAEIVRAIRQAAELTLALPASAIYGQYGALMADYYAPALVDLADSITPPDLPRLLAWPDGVHPDRWCDATARLHLWHAVPITRLMLSFWVPDAVQFQTVEIECNGAVLTREPVEPGHVRRIACHIPARGARYLDIVLRFDFLQPLQPPDLRRCAAMFSGIEISEGGPWRKVEMPEAPRS